MPPTLASIETRRKRLEKPPFLRHSNKPEMPPTDIGSHPTSARAAHTSSALGQDQTKYTKATRSLFSLFFLLLSFSHFVFACTFLLCIL